MPLNRNSFVDILMYSYSVQFFRFIVSHLRIKITCLILKVNKISYLLFVFSFLVEPELRNCVRVCADPLTKTYQILIIYL